MNDLLDSVIAAHGGLDRWNQLTTARLHLHIGGVMWPMKGQGGVIDEIDSTVTLHHQLVDQYPFTANRLRARFSADRVALETEAGRTVDERPRPRDSFRDHGLRTPWDDIDLAYFAGYAIWNYLTAPFCFVTPGFRTEEAAPWSENGEKWRRLEVTFPDHIAAHGKKQTFYFGENDGLLRRIDFDTEVLGGAPAAHYAGGYEEIDGIVVPTERRVYVRNADGTVERDPLLVSLRFEDVTFS
jgi:hypothetical protein